MLRTWPTLLDRGHVSVGVYVARAAAVSQFTDRILAIRVFRLLVRAGFIVTRMAAGTVRLESRVSPRNNFGIGLVTLGTEQVAAVIQRFERCRSMAELIRQPGSRVVAAVAFDSRNEVSGVFTGRGCAVMAGRTGAQYLAMVNIQHRRPCCGHVTGFAHIGGQGVLRVLAGGDYAVVATNAIARDIGVIVIRR